MRKESLDFINVNRLDYLDFKQEQKYGWFWIFDVSLLSRFSMDKKNDPKRIILKTLLEFRVSRFVGLQVEN